MTQSSRLDPLDPATLTPEQRNVYDDIVSGPRGGIAGPFEPWLRSPQFASLAQRLGEFCRYRTTLEPLLSETAILVIASHHRAQIEWFAHAPIAIAAGLANDDAETIRQGRIPDFADERLAVVALTVDHLLQTSRLPDDLYARAVGTLGEHGLVELIGLMGYYNLVALTLNVFRPPIPDNAPEPFPEYS